MADINWVIKRPGIFPEDLGLLPLMIYDTDPRPAREQFNERYAHGGGWHPFKGFTVTDAGLQYPDDPPMGLIAECRLRDEVIRVYDCAWVSITQSDGSVEIAKMD